MSSLLDILHRRDSQPEDPSVTAPAPEPAAPATAELRLAIDNGPEPPAIELAVETPPPAAEPGPEPLPLPPPATDATRVLMARQLTQRSRRSTVLLATGLTAIVAGAAVATWLVNEARDASSGADSQFTAPPVAGVVERPGPAGTAPAAASAAPATPAAAPVATGNPVAATPPAAAGSPMRGAEPAADTAWYDTPAEAPVIPVRITRGTTANPLYEKLSTAWTAFQAADFPRAEALYREVRAADATNIDALLGLAALAVRGGRLDEARDLYRAVLLAEPRNAAATSALSALPAAGGRQLGESELKNLLREQPTAAHLHFALGLLYAGETRWPEAQAAFFEAVRYDAADADYAYNLAVSLDHLAQGTQAAAWYQRALDLHKPSSLFDTTAAGNRLASLNSTAP